LTCRQTKAHFRPEEKALATALAISLAVGLTGCPERSQSSASGKPEFCYLANTGATVCDSDYNVHGRAERRQAAERKQP